MSPAPGPDQNGDRDAGTQAGPTGDARPTASPSDTGNPSDAPGESASSPAGDVASLASPDDASGASPPDEDETGHEMSLLEHLGELRSRVLRCAIAAGIGFLACYAVAEDMLRIFLRPLLEVLPPKSTLIATTLPEKFFTVLKMAFLGGFLVASPYIFYQIWRFIAPGLYKEERQALVPVALATAFFFTGGGVFGYFVVFPFAFAFFVNYAGELITIMPTVSNYFSFAVMLLIAFGVVFELPVVLYFLARIGLVTARGLRKNRRWAILGAFILGALLTPADPISQCLMAGPLIVLYEVGIVAAALFGKKVTPPQASPDGMAGAPSGENSSSGKLP
ncbi:twin-arginine translocase subunit TatC [Desulfolutivibrio sulfoxidireducens]|uniref:twin-arginine translocase subunit TatC n=1 Tax=Desulfolutivibrio sulfoxidireducens TaxID=2773299 RepID=UPI002109DF00|nr:twin-arginine translocase subunit TatC [Desulfolutivibrio sulfoxidireducens]